MFASAHPKLVRGPMKNFKEEHYKFGLKFSMCIPMTSGLVGVTARKLTTEKTCEFGPIQIEFFDRLYSGL